MVIGCPLCDGAQGAEIVHVHRNIADMLINFVNYRNQRSQKLKLIVQQNAQVVMELLASP